MEETKAAMIQLIEARRELAIRLLNGFAAGAFDQPHTPEDIAHCEAEIADCDAELARLLGEAGTR
jgi:hypothetical protein